MLSEKQVQELRTHLEKAQNPVFFFDNDPDGLCSFLLLQRFIGRGKGVPIRGSPELTGDYFRRVKELNSDYVFILDKPKVSEEFLEEILKYNLPTVWIDHHEIIQKAPEFVNYFNPLSNKKRNNEPVSVLCYQVTHKKEDLWLAVLGAISDNFIPDFYSDFKEYYPDLYVDSENALDIYYNSELGKIIKILGAGLKDRTTNVINMIKFLMKVNSPYDVLEETPKNYSLHKRFKEIDNKYRKLFRKAVLCEKDSGKILFFKYGGDLSISRELANGLSQKFPEKIIVVAYVSGIKVNISVNGRNIRELILTAIEGLPDSTGGGHENAVGAKIRVEDLKKFKERFRKLVG